MQLERDVSLVPVLVDFDKIAFMVKWCIIVREIKWVRNLTMESAAPLCVFGLWYLSSGCRGCQNSPKVLIIVNFILQQFESNFHLI